jgi:hypothetical protein
MAAARNTIRLSYRLSDHYHLSPLASPPLAVSVIPALAKAHRTMDPTCADDAEEVGLYGVLRRVHIIVAAM